MVITVVSLMSAWFLDSELSTCESKEIHILTQKLEFMGFYLCMLSNNEIITPL